MVGFGKRGRKGTELSLEIDNLCPHVIICFLRLSCLGEVAIDMVYGRVYLGEM